jgi:hypothetical protein
MTESMNFFAGLIEWSDGETSHLKRFWARGNHLGEALHKMISAAEAGGIENPILTSAEYFNIDDLPDTATTHDNGETYIDEATVDFPSEPTFRLPYGVIESFAKGGYKTEDLTVGYAIDAPDEDDEDERDVKDEEKDQDEDEDEEEDDDDEDESDLIEIRAVVEEEQLLNTYMVLVDALSDISVFWIKLQDDCGENDREEIYVNEELISSGRIKEFIERNRRDILKNGHVTITTYSRTGETNLNISDHKMIVVLTYDNEIATQICGLLEQQGVPSQYQLVAPDEEFHHWHYRHPDSHDRKDLIASLKNQGFKHWNY